MNRILKKRKSTLFYILPLVVILVLQLTGALAVIENTSSDYIYQKGTSVSPNIYVVGIDEDTLNTYGDFSTWSRDKIADLINLLSKDKKNKPAVIALDIGYYGRKDKKTDDKLVKAVKDAGNVVLVSTATFGNVTNEDSSGQFTDSNEVVLYEEPFKELKEAALAVGHSNTQPDSDGIVRHALGTLNYKNKKYESFASKIASAYGKTSTIDDTSKPYYIRYAGKPRSFYGSIGAASSLKNVLSGEYPASAFKDNIVMVGAYASGLQDQYFTSIDRVKPMYGVEIHANILQQTLDDVEISETSAIVRNIIAVVVWLLGLLLVLKLDTRFSAPLLFILSGLYTFGVSLIYKNLNLVLPVTHPPLILLGLLLTHIILRYFTVHREKKRIIASYGKYLSPEVAATIADNGEESLALGGQKKDIAVLFVDIRSFTTLLEQLPPERVVEMLNSYLKITTSAIFNNQGTVDKFIGDATMGVFNAPLDLEDYTYKAVCAGLEMARNSIELAKNLPDDLKGRVGFGVGINAGEAIVGNIGTDFRMEYTAIGDTVNTASRLEGQAKAGTVIISEEVYNRIKDRIRCVDAGSVKLKGKANEAHIYQAIEVIDSE